MVVDKVRNGKGAFGFNAATETYEDLLKAGVVDPAKVVRCALQNAASVAGSPDHPPSASSPTSPSPRRPAAAAATWAAWVECGRYGVEWAAWAA